MDSLGTKIAMCCCRVLGLRGRAEGGQWAGVVGVCWYGGGVFFRKRASFL